MVVVVSAGVWLILTFILASSSYTSPLLQGCLSLRVGDVNILLRAKSTTVTYSQHLGSHESLAFVVIHCVQRALCVRLRVALIYRSEQILRR